MGKNDVSGLLILIGVVLMLTGNFWSGLVLFIIGIL